MFGGTENDTLIGDSRVDTLESKFHGDDYLDGGSGDDFFLIGDSSWTDVSATFEGTAGDDRLLGGPGNDGLIIGDHNPFSGTLLGGGDDELSGGPGDDALFGDHWADVGGVTSGDGDDQCGGGPGTDSAASCEAITGVP